MVNHGAYQSIALFMLVLTPVAELTLIISGKHLQYIFELTIFAITLRQSFIVSMKEGRSLVSTSILQKTFDFAQKLVAILLLDADSIHEKAMYGSL